MYRTKLSLSYDHSHVISQAFNVVFHKAIEKAEPSDDVKIRVNQLIDSITYSVFMYTTRFTGQLQQPSSISQFFF